MYRQQIVGSGATDIVGALSAMGVFDMGAPTSRRIRLLQVSCRRLMLLMQMPRRLFLRTLTRLICLHDCCDQCG